jgi:acyl-CoA dehydrogenase
MSSQAIRLKPRPLGPACEELRLQVRAFLRDELQSGRFVPQCDCWLKGVDRAFSRRLGARGWLGLTWPKRYGGGERSPFERFVVIEELLAAGAPVAGHWIAERQMGPSVLRHGTEEQKQLLLPGIARGDFIFAGGYSEPDVGSDLAAVKTRAEKVPGGWRVSGTKVWTSQAHHADYMLVLCRTEAAGGDKHHGLSILMVQLPAAGLTMQPIPVLTGEHHFNEVHLDKVEVPDSMVLGAPGDGWKIITSELVLERSGPERFMSTFPLLVELVRRAEQGADDRVLIGVGELVARFRALRNMSIAVAGALEDGLSPGVEAAMVKDMGTRFEGDVAECARQLYETEPVLDSPDRFTSYLAQSVLHTPSFTLRGGANEILRGIIARGLGVR